ncbi:MAG: hypothetical protein IMY71_13115 [Bacteroidetes bacterium]|nr:hypothetical protein [Bacteroidota bacterium]
MKRRIYPILTAVLLVITMLVYFGCEKQETILQPGKKTIGDSNLRKNTPDNVWECTYNNMGSFDEEDIKNYWNKLIGGWYSLGEMYAMFGKKHNVIDIETYYDKPSYTNRYPTAREVAQQTIKKNIQYADAYYYYASQVHPDNINSESGLAGIKINAGAGLSSTGKVYFEFINNATKYVDYICSVAITDWEKPITLKYRIPFDIEIVDGETQEVTYMVVTLETTMKWMIYIKENFDDGNPEEIWKKSAPIIGVYGNANGDETINMQDVTYTELIILEYRDRTRYADALYDGMINMQDITQIELIITGENKELWVDILSYFRGNPNLDYMEVRHIGDKYYENIYVETITVQEQFRFATDLGDEKYPDIFYDE